MFEATCKICKTVVHNAVQQPHMWEIAIRTIEDNLYNDIRNPVCEACSMEVVMLLHSLANNSKSPECRWCHRKLYNLTDIQHKYCPCCGGSYMPKNCEHRLGNKDIELAAYETEKEAMS